MAKRKPASWRKRRWTIFLKTYSENEQFRNELSEYHSNIKKGHQYIKEDLQDILPKYGVSYLCSLAVGKYLDNPNLDDSKYLAVMVPPIFIGSSLNTTLEPMPKRYDKLSADTFISDPEATLPDGLHYNTELSIQPYVTISELHELIDEYWKEIESRINQRTKHGDKIYGTSLLGKVQPPKLKRVAERDELIMSLYAEGMNGKQIQDHLIQKTIYSAPSPEYIRVIISRNKRKMN